MALPDEELVNYQIQIEATLALKNLADLTSATQSFKQKIQETTVAIQSASQQWGVPFDVAKNKLQQLDERISGTKESSVVFGGAGQAAWDKVGRGATEAGQAVQKSSNQMVGGINIVRTALHILIAGAIFEVINAFRQMFTEAINGLKSLEVSVYNLANAEKALSESGIKITFKELEAIVDRLHTKFDGLFSKVKLQDAVADIAIATKELGLSAKQIEMIAQSAAALQLRNPDKTLQQVTQQLLTAILSGQTKGIRSLGVAANEATIQQKALEMGLVAVGQKADEQAKSLATLQLIYEATSKDAQNLNQYQMSVAGATQQLSAIWQDFLAELAKDFAPLIIQGLKILIFDLQLGAKIIESYSPIIRNVTSSIAAMIVAIKSLRVGEGFFVFLASIGAAGNKFNETKKIFDGYFDHFVESADTATSAVENLGNAFDAAGFEDKLDDIVKKTEESLEDLQTTLLRKQEDLDTEYQRKAQDALIDYNRKVEDINQKSNDKITEIKRKHREDDQKREREYQLKLWELQQKFLMDLEDALHNRDARQILRLQRQYEFDKLALEKKKQLDDKASKVDQSSEIKKVEEDRKKQLEDAKKDYERKLQDLNIAKAREQADLQKWYDREYSDIKLAQRRKLEALIDGWIKEGKITQKGAQQVYDILKSYFGPGGATDQLYAYMIQSLMANAANLIAVAGTVPNIITPIALTNPSATGGAYSGGLGTTGLGTFAGGLAEGGSFLATTPQTIRVAENTPELITATPLGKIGNDMNKLFMQAGMNKNSESTMGGQLELGVTLSPDLETRIIRKSLDGAADVVMRVNRSKV